MATSTTRLSSVGTTTPPSTDTTPLPESALWHRLLTVAIIAPDDWDQLNPADRTRIEQERHDGMQLDLLLAAGLLTEYQVSRIRAGRGRGLVLGNYRVLDRIGSGGMGVVYRGEHRRLRQMVAIKALQGVADPSPRTLGRFFVEMRAIAQIKHPNIVSAIDAGEEAALGPDTPPIPYFVMEYVPGKDLELTVTNGGPLPIATACHLAHQIADALLEAHRHGLVHRDIKPSNILITPDGQAKLLDFGLAKLPTDKRLTMPGSRLGTIGYMSPEQARDASTVDVRADVFGLGCTLFYALTGQAPFLDVASAALGPPPSASLIRPDVPAGLDTALSRMMAANPEHRYPTAEGAMRALLPYLPTAPRPSSLIPPPEPRIATSGLPHSKEPPVTPSPLVGTNRVLIVDDQSEIRRLCRIALTAEGFICDEAGTGPDAVTNAASKPYDLVLLDVDLPGFSGEEVLRRLRQAPGGAHQKVLMFSGNASGDELSRILLSGADDFLTKPFSIVQLRARVKAALRLKEAQDRSDMLNRRLLTVNAELEQTLTAKDSELLRARNALVLALAKIVEHRSAETGPHLMRLQRYCKVLAEEASIVPAFASQLDPNFTRLLEDCAPLHDIGKAALPDHILNKPGALDPNERLLMQAHTTIGAETLREVSRQYPFATGFLQMAIDIARSHHEKWDGTGYPDRLSGEAIPLAARLVAIADVYDALRSKRVYKPALSHTSTVLTMTDSSPGHFDPALMEVFHRCASQFDRIFREFGE